LKLFLIAIIVLSTFLVFVFSDFVSRRKEIRAHSYVSRIILGVSFFCLGLFVLAHFKGELFYLNERNELLFDSRYPRNLNDWPRFIWCGAITLMGFGFAAVQSRFSQKLPYFSYAFFYPFPLFLITCLGYSILSLNSLTRGHIFYPLSFVVCGTVSAMIDKYWDMAAAFAKR
jgi:hypothetical protein